MSKIKKYVKISTKGQKIIIRSAMLKDAHEILKLNRAIIREGPYMLHEKDEYNKTISQEENFIRKLNGSPGSIYIVAEVRRKAIGYITFINGSLRRTSHIGYIALFITKNFRNRGIGKLLLVNLINWAELNPQIEKLSLAVFSNNIRAIALYKKIGFKQEGRCLKDMKINGEYIDSLLMYKFVK